MLRCMLFFVLLAIINANAQEKMGIPEKIEGLFDSTGVSVDTICVQGQKQIILQKDAIRVCYNLAETGREFVWCEFAIKHPCYDKNLLTLSNYWHKKFGLVQETYEHGEDDLLYNVTFRHFDVELSASMDTSFMLSGRRKQTKTDVLPLYEEQTAHIKFANYLSTECEVKMQSANFVRYTRFAQNQVEYIYRLE